MPVTAIRPQHVDIVMTPAASAKAGRRPWLIATFMIAMLLGPGLPAAMT